jgi:hypothetical protein
MQHIGQHIRGEAPKKKNRDTERGELMQYFMEKLNLARVRDGLPPLTMARMGRTLVAIPTKDLYYLKSVCDDSLKRTGLDAFCKKFWWEVKPRKEEDKKEKKK